MGPVGAPVGDPVQVRVRFRPTDSWVLSVGGVVVGLVVLVGLVRAMRRPRRRATAGAAPDPDTLEEETR